jgi:hypothetical protein
VPPASSRFLAAAAALVVIVLGATASAGTMPTGTAASKCLSRGGLPDRHCTPGVNDPRVTKANLKRTACNTHYRRVNGKWVSWSKAQRPDSSYTDRLKVQGIADYGYADKKQADYEEDHVLPISIGGSPTSPKNLWPEAYAGSWGSKKKDDLEYQLYKRVCAGKYKLSTAQNDLSRNWKDAYKRLGL